jgi:hypothetical protein
MIFLALIGVGAVAMMMVFWSALWSATHPAGADRRLAARQAKVRAKVDQRIKDECSQLPPTERFVCEGTMYGKVDGGIIWSEDWGAVIGMIFGLLFFVFLIAGAFALS